MKIFSHRGSHEAAQENSWAAFSKSVTEGATGIELDIIESKDGHGIIIHDDNILNLTGVDKNISECSLDEIQAFTLNDKSPIPTLDQVLERLLPLTELNLEIKQASVDFIKKTASKILSSPFQNKVVFSSFELPYVKLLRENFPKLNTALLWDKNSDLQEILQTMKDLGTTRLHLCSENITEEIKAGFHACGWTLWIWFPLENHDELDPQKRALNLDPRIDCIITNHPASYTREELNSLNLTEPSA